MSKCVLVMDMPSSCSKCDFQAMNVRDNPICILCTESCVEQFKTKDEYKRINTDLRTKPEWCPLKPMPEKVETFNCEELCDVDDWYDSGYHNGYNACIDEILNN